MKKGYFILGLLFLLSIPAIFSLLRPGFYEPHDLHHIADIYQMVRAIETGQIPPRLGPDFTFGYGYPLFNFYYLLPFYLGALWFFLIGSLTSAFEFVFIATVAISVFGMYLFLREFVGKFPAVAGSILFLYTPYRAVEIYVRGAIGEALALSLLPFVAWSIIRLIKHPDRKAVVRASLILALFLLAHNYLWVLVAPWLVLLALILIYQKKRKKKPVLSLLLATILALGITFYWWFPALLEQKLVASVTPFLLRDHFPFIKQLIIPSWGYGASVWGPGDGLSFQIGVVNLAIVALSLGVLVFARKLIKNKELLYINLWAIFGFFVSLFMMNIRSLPLWRLIPFYNFIQFPWRLLFLTTFFTSILAAILVEVLEKPKRKIAAFLIIAASVLLTVSYFRPSKTVFKSDDEYLTRFFENESYSEDYLLLPNWTSSRPTGSAETKIESLEAGVTNIEQVSLVSWRAEVSSDDLAKITFNTYYFPGWFAKVDGEFANINPGEPHGQIELLVPEGEHTVEFFWKETDFRKKADLVSLASLLLIFGLLVYPHWRRGRKS